MKAVSRFGTSTDRGTAGDGDGFVLRETAPYAHAHAYVEDVLRQNSFSIVDHKTALIRKERGGPVPGCYYIAKVEQK